MDKTLLFVQKFLPTEALGELPLSTLPRLVAKAEYLRDIEVGIVQEAIGRAFSES